MRAPPGDDRSTVFSRGDGVPAHGPVAREGEAVGGYVLEELVGEGGMGVVFRARDPELSRTVAVKLIAPQLANDPRFRELFVNEALAVAGLEHPHVLPVHRAGEDDGRLFIAMRLVEGESLQALVEREGGLALARAARVVAQVAEALDAAHARGIVHRDVKPGNVLIAGEPGREHVYLSDFGLSTHSTSDGRRSHRWVGTPEYVAPEQIRGEPATPAGDIYSLGCLLVFALTGNAPFSAAHEEGVLVGHLTSPPPRLGDLLSSAPRALDTVVVRALAKRPGDRFPTAGELARAVQEARHDAVLAHARRDAHSASTLRAALVTQGLDVRLVEAPSPDWENVFNTAAAAAILVGRGGPGPWTEDALDATSRRVRAERGFEVLLVFLPGAPEPSPGAPAVRVLDLRTGLHGDGVGELVHLVRTARPSVEAEGAECPFQGLLAFEEETAEVFFGREAEVARAVEKFTAAHFLAVLGPSGSGKSSLVRAGVVPALRREAAERGSDLHVEVVTPGDRPVDVLAAAMARIERAPRQATLVVDQAEEVFTLCSDERARADFFARLTEIGGDPDTGLVIAMRADFYPRCASYPGLAALMADQQLLVGPLDRDGLRRAIEEPARVSGLLVEPGLTRRMLDDIADRSGSLPLVQHVLLELWRHRSGRVLTIGAYAASGGVEGALARRANLVYAALGPERQKIARHILLRLTQPGEGSEDTRRRVRLSELATPAAGEAEVAVVVAALAEARLLTSDVDPVSGQQMAEIAHEALIRGWPELRAWIDADREWLRLHRRLTEAAAEWEERGRDPESLYREARLAPLADRNLDDLNQVERDFLDAGRERVGQAARGRRRRVRIALAGLAAGVVVAGSVAAVAVVRGREAAAERNRAISRGLAASAQSQLGLDPELALLLARRAHEVDPGREAEEALRQAVFESRVDAGIDTGQRFLASAEIHPDARRVLSSAPNGPVLLSDLSGRDPPIQMPGNLGFVVSARFGPADRVVTAGLDGTVRLWTPSTQDVRILRGIDGSAYTAALSVDGRVAAGGASDGTVRVWDVRTSRTLRVMRGRGEVYALVFSPDGTSIATAGSDGVIRVFDEDGRVTIVGRHEGPARAVQFSRDGGRLLSAGVGGAIVWNVGGGPPIPLGGNAGTVRSAAFSPDGRAVVTGGEDGLVRIWQLARGSSSVVAGHASSVWSVAFTADGERIFSSGQDGSLRLWRWRTAAARELRGHTGNVWQVAVARRGDVVASAGADGTVRVWRGGTATPDVFSPHGGRQVRALDLTDDGRLLATMGDDGRARVRDLVRGREVVALNLGVNPLIGSAFGPQASVAIDPRGRRVAAASVDGAVRLWELGKPGGPRLLRGHLGPVASLSFGPDGRHVLSAGADGTVRIWAVAGGRPTILSQPATGARAAFSLDGRLVVSTDLEGTARVWDWRAEKVLATIPAHRGIAFDADFTPDGRAIVTAGNDGRLRVWDWRRGVVLVALRQEGFAFGVDALPDGRRFVSASDDGGVRVWECDVCGPIEEVVALSERRTTRDLTPDERERFRVPGA